MSVVISIGDVDSEFHMSIEYVGVVGVLIPTSIMIPTMPHLPMH